MTLALIPQPRKLTVQERFFTMPTAGSVGIADGSLHEVAEEARCLFAGASVNVTIPGVPDTMTLACDDALPAGGYTLKVNAQGVRIVGRDVAAVFHGLQTLEQVISQVKGRQVPHLSIKDWPDFADRGVYYDVCRGRVPTLDRLIELAAVLAHYKINQLQLYIEHTFVFRGHPKIGRGASPLSADDILQLDAFCRDRHIELLPSLAGFGHLATVLKHKEYHDLAEDWGVGRYTAPEEELPRWFHSRAWTLSPANPKTYDFLDSLFAEFLPLFSSKRFNICCDETWDLGLGQSYELCKRKGKGRVYLDHILKVRNLCRKHGKKILFWGDIIRHHPELIGEIPKDVTVLDWGYGANHPFDSIRDFKAAGLPFYACPGTSAWVSLFPRLHESKANIAGFAAAGRKNGAQGLLNTDWGDGGHYNFMEFSWYGYLFGAEQAWNTKADQKSFSERFARLFLNTARKDMTGAIELLGDVTHLGYPGYYQSVWQTLFFACPGDAVLEHTEPADAAVCRNGELGVQKVSLNAKLGRETLKQLAKVKAVFEAHAKSSGADPHGVLPYWIFAVDTIAHAAKKLTVLGPGGADTPAARRRLGREMASLMKRFEELWMARNRPSEIRITLKRYKKAIKSLGA